MQQDTKFTILNSTGGIIAALIPVIQFAFGWFPSQLNKIFIQENLIFFTTAITFLFSIFIVFLASIKKQIFTFFGKYYHTDNLANSSLVIIFAASLIFLGIGGSLQEGNHPWWALFQAFCYIITITSSVFFIVIYSIEIKEKKNKEENSILRARRAISLAIEHDAFEDFPRINFIKALDFEKDSSAKATTQVATDSNLPDGFTVHIKISNEGKSQNYIITTNEDATVLKDVRKYT